jgi:ribosomal protein S18 acetylase RimI-like enzyme
VASTLDVERHDRTAVPGLRDELVDVHADARAELLGNPFYSRERFAERLDAYAQDPDFDLVVGRVDGRLVGYAFGGPLGAATRWWTGLLEQPDPDLTRETGRRTFAFREIIVGKAYQRRGHAHQLHDALLGGRQEERATLLVRGDNPARDLYLRWGWRLVGKVQPFPDSPVFDSMVLDLPLTPPG